MTKHLLSLLAAGALLLAGSNARAATAPVSHAPDVFLPTRRAPLPVPANPRLPSIFLIGDSTVRNGRDDGQGKGPAGQWGWGHLIAQYFDASKVNLVNRAVGGLSSRTYLTYGYWAGTLAMLKPGDVVIMQFGHNDGGPVNDRFRARASLRGAGDQTEAIDNLLTGKHEIVHTYGWYLRQFVQGARAKGATPVICTLIPRKLWDSAGRIRRNNDTYAGWAKEVAREEHVPLVDLNNLVADQYDRLGRAAVMKLFPDNEHTHTNWAGADLNARTVVAALKAMHPDPIAKYLSARAAGIAPLPEPASR